MQQAGSCATCLKAIQDKTWVTGESKKEYHAACFTCAECKTPVAANVKYFEIPSPSARVGSIVRCASCQKNYNCAVCKGTIAVLVHKKYEGRLYHTDCWRCESCNGSLSKTPASKGGQLFCPECDAKDFRGVCVRCKGSCRGDFTEALQQQWHGACLTCFKCKAPFPDGQFYVVDKVHPACKQHAQ